MLNNPFYIGVIVVGQDSRTFSGKHQPLISVELFHRVRDRLHGRTPIRVRTHDFVLRGLFTCTLYELVSSRLQPVRESKRKLASRG